MGLDQWVHRYDKQTKECDEVGYFRKANWIHKYIIDLVGGDNAESEPLTRDMIKDLLNKLNLVVSTYRKITTKTKGLPKGYITISQEGKKQLTRKGIKALEKILPPQEGFFFGTTEFSIDDNGQCFIIEIMKENITTLKEVLKHMRTDNYTTAEKNKKGIEYFYSSWW